ncbi:hypothetical protein HGRIS_006071 [Hohenbuehelia grisea]|uniref:G-protein coupled receptors family 2 profile 2 domain-containing protein n=1 Tax=Hohenbuehelia grisea TaxID=104357 RepID=A0ABR3JZQ5_9AGAR
MVQTWAAIHYAIFQKMILLRRSSLVLLLGGPYTIAASLFTGFLVFGIHNPDTVGRDPTGVYCSIAYNNIPARVTAGLCGVLLFASLVVEVVLGRLLVVHWHKLSKTGSYLTLIIRVMLFSFVGGVALGLTIVYVTASGNGIGADFLYATRKYCL